MVESEKEDLRKEVLVHLCGKVVSLSGSIMRCCNSSNRGLLGGGSSCRGDKMGG